MAMTSREGRRGSLGLELDNNRNGEGRDGDGGTKLLRSSWKNLEGGESPLEYLPFCSCQKSYAIEVNNHCRYRIFNKN